MSNRPAQLSDSPTAQVAPEQTYLGNVIASALANGEAIKDLLVRTDEPVYAYGPSGLKDIGSDPIALEDLQVLAQALDPEWEEAVKTGGLDRPLKFLGANLRVNLGRFDSGRGLAAAIRMIPTAPPSLASLQLPPVAENFVKSQRGLILVVGATSSGKTTTLAGMVDFLNERNSGHLITLENPIEIQHHSKRSVVTQREIGVDVASYTCGLQDAMRQAPYGILVGEVRTEEAAKATLETAESGHLVLTSMHASSSIGALIKLVSWSRGEEELRAHALAQNVVGVIAQALLPSVDKTSWVPIYEVLPATDQICEAVRKRDFDGLAKHMRDGALPHAISFGQALKDAERAGRISAQTAASFLAEPAQLYRLGRSGASA